MHPKQHRKPHWRLLNVLLFIAIGGLIVTHSVHLTPTGHKIALFLCIVISYGLIGLWLKSNDVALQEEYSRQDPAVYGTSKFPTPTQAHFKKVLLFYRNESSSKQ